MFLADHTNFHTNLRSSRASDQFRFDHLHVLIKPNYSILHLSLEKVDFAYVRLAFLF